MSSSIDQQKPEKASNHNFDGTIRIDKEKTIIPYPEQEFDVYEEYHINEVHLRHQHY